MKNLLVGLLGALVITGPACVSPADERGDETHFQACRTNEDCRDAGQGATCERGYCRAPLQGGGGTPADGTSSEASVGSSEASVGGRPACHDGTQARCADGDGIGGVAGAMHVRGCPELMQAGLESVDCPDAAGDTAKAALVAWCQHVENVEEGFLHQEVVAACGAVDGLDVDTVCAPRLPEVLRTCADSLRPCERLPLCAGDGVYGCDQIRQDCPGLSATACRSGFDSRPFAGRNEIRDCLTTAPDTEDCVAAFYRCVWGL